MGKYSEGDAAGKVFYNPLKRHGHKVIYYIFTFVICLITALREGIFSLLFNWLYLHPLIALLPFFQVGPISVCFTR